MMPRLRYCATLPLSKEFRYPTFSTNSLQITWRPSVSNLNRYDQMQRLNRQSISLHDEEEAAYVAKWNSDHPHSRILDLFIFAVLVAILSATGCFLFMAQPKASKATVQTCNRTCHTRLTYATYRRSVQPLKAH